MSVARKKNKRHRHFPSSKGSGQRIPMCSAITAVMLIATYVLENIAYPIGMDTRAIARVEAFRQYWRPDNDIVDDNVLFLNVSHDKTLIPYYPDADTSSTTPGYNVITDREKLLRFLQLAEKSDYKYLFLDIRMEKGYESPVDSALVEQLSRMKNVSLAKHWNVEEDCLYPMIDKRLEPLASYCDFDEQKSRVGFFRYKYLQNGEPSIALKMYQSVAGRDVKRHGAIFADGSRLCHNSHFLTFKKDAGRNIIDDGEINGAQFAKYSYYEMGSFMLDDSIPHNIKMLMMENQCVIVGDFENDMNSTYAGYQPGVYIHYQGFRSLMNHQHFVRWWYTLLMAAVYFILLYRIFSPKERIPKWKIWIVNHLPTVDLLIESVKYTIIVSVIVLTLYFFCNIAYNIFVPSTVLGILSHIINLKNRKPAVS